MCFNNSLKIKPFNRLREDLQDAIVFLIQWHNILLEWFPPYCLILVSAVNLAFYVNFKPEYCTSLLISDFEVNFFLPDFYLAHYLILYPPFCCVQKFLCTAAA